MLIVVTTLSLTASLPDQPTMVDACDVDQEQAVANEPKCLAVLDPDNPGDLLEEFEEGILSCSEFLAPVDVDPNEGDLERCEGSTFDDVVSNHINIVVLCPSELAFDCGETECEDTFANMATERERGIAGNFGGAIQDLREACVRPDVHSDYSASRCVIPSSHINDGADRTVEVHPYSAPVAFTDLEISNGGRTRIRGEYEIEPALTNQAVEVDDASVCLQGRDVVRRAIVTGLGKSGVYVHSSGEVEIQHGLVQAGNPGMRIDDADTLFRGTWFIGNEQAIEADTTAAGPTCESWLHEVSGTAMPLQLGGRTIPLHNYFISNLGGIDLDGRLAGYFVDTVFAYHDQTGTSPRGGLIYTDGGARMTALNTLAFRNQDSAAPASQSGRPLFRIANSNCGESLLSNLTAVENGAEEILGISSGGIMYVFHSLIADNGGKAISASSASSAGLFGQLVTNGTLHIWANSSNSDPTCYGSPVIYDSVTPTPSCYVASLSPSMGGSSPTSPYAVQDDLTFSYSPTRFVNAEMLTTSLGGVTSEYFPNLSGSEFAAWSIDAHTGESQSCMNLAEIDAGYHVPYADICVSP